VHEFDSCRGRSAHRSTGRSGFSGGCSRHLGGILVLERDLAIYRTRGAAPCTTKGAPRAPFVNVRDLSYLEQIAYAVQLLFASPSFIVTVHAPALLG
jgi:hypothetical protein